MSIPVTFDPLPNTYGWGKVVGRVIHGVADTAEDSDDKPQARAAAGKVHFDPKNTLSKTPAGADYTALVLQSRETANLSSSGRILDAEGRNGIWLIAGIWSVSFELQSGAKIKPFEIEVTTAHSDAEPLDLATQAPYTDPGGLTVRTMLVPTGGSDGQVLALDEASGTLVWVDGGGGGVASWAEIEALPDKPALVVSDDSRLSNQRVPVDGSVAYAKLNSALQASITKADASLNQAQVDARVQQVVGAAPAALDTLVEFAAALGNDPDFAATILTALGTKVVGREVHVYYTGSSWPSRPSLTAGQYVVWNSVPYISAPQPTMLDTDQWDPHPHSAIYGTLG